VLYSLFKENEITYNGPFLNGSYPHNKPYLLKNKVQTLLTNIKNLSDTRKTTIAQNISTKIVEQSYENEIKKFMRERNLLRNQVIIDMEKKKYIIDATQQNIFCKINQLQILLTKLEESSFSNLCDYLSYPRGVEEKTQTNKMIEEVRRIRIIRNNRGNNKNKMIYLNNDEEKDMAIKIREQINNIVGIRKDYLQYFGIDMTEVMNYFSTQLRNNSSTWIKTPSLVITYNNPNVMGGHNLASSIRFVRGLTTINTIDKVGGSINKGLNDMNVSNLRKRVDVIPIIQREQRGYNNKIRKI
jgi:hypothetical protein